MRIIIGTSCVIIAIALNFIRLSFESNRQPPFNFDINSSPKDIPIQRNNNNNDDAGARSNLVTWGKDPQEAARLRSALRSDHLAVQQAAATSNLATWEKDPQEAARLRSALRSDHSAVEQAAARRLADQQIAAHHSAPQQATTNPLAVHQVVHHPSGALSLFDQRPATHPQAANQFFVQHEVAQHSRNQQEPDNDSGLLELTLATRGHQ